MLVAWHFFLLGSQLALLLLWWCGLTSGLWLALPTIIAAGQDVIGLVIALGVAFYRSRRCAT